MAIRLFPTPVERHMVNGRTVFVKREDLCSVRPAPALGKLRGLDALIQRWVAEGRRVIGCWDTRVSELGIGLAVAMQSVPDGRAVVCYPQLKGEAVPTTIRIASSLGAEVVAMRGNHVSICVAQARRLVEERGGVLLPFGLECAEAVEAVALEARTLPSEYVSDGTLVLSCGSGVTLSGILRGLAAKPSRIVGVSSGRSIRKLSQCLRRFCGRVPPHVDLIPAELPYDTPASCSCPFPSHPNYDRKAWMYFCEHLSEFRSPLLFWNIGSQIAVER